MRLRWTGSNPVGVDKLWYPRILPAYSVVLCKLFAMTVTKRFESIEVA